MCFSLTVLKRLGNLSWLGIIAAIVLAYQPANATVLTFDGIGDVNGTPMPGTYGNRVNTTNDLGTGYQYGSGNGLTPNISIAYAPSVDPYSLWVDGYAELTNALGHQLFDIPGEIVFTPDPGYRVRLNSFDIAGWDIDYPTQIAIYDDNGSVAFPNLFSADLVVPEANSVDPLINAILATGALHIFVDNLGSTGLDNINFDQVQRISAVPLPAAIWLFGSGLLALIGLARSRRRARPLI